MGAALLAIQCFVMLITVVALPIHGELVYQTKSPPCFREGLQYKTVNNKQLKLFP
jgi:hypothetical protein